MARDTLVTGHTVKVSVFYTTSACSSGTRTRERARNSVPVTRGLCVLVVYFSRTPSRAPYRTPSACANRAAYPDPPPVAPDPESIDAQACHGNLTLTWTCETTSTWPRRTFQNSPEVWRPPKSRSCLEAASKGSSQGLHDEQNGLCTAAVRDTFSADR